MINLEGKSLLVIAPHPDDEVIGCGGLMQRVKAAGGKVYVLFLCVADSNDFSKRGRSSADERLEEIHRVAKFMQFDGWHIAFAGDAFHLQLDHTPQKELIHAIERGEHMSLETIRPDIVAFPQFTDYNQDHRAAAEAAFAACRPAPQEEKYVPPVILSYEAPMNSWATMNGGHNQQPNFFIDITPDQLQHKLQAMALYDSQLRGPHHPRHLETLKAFAQVRGSSIGAPFAEAFISHKVVVAKQTTPPPASSARRQETQAVSATHVQQQVDNRKIGNKGSAITK